MRNPVMKYNPLLLLLLTYVLLGSSHAREIPAGKKLTADYVFIPGGFEYDSIAVKEFYISAIEVTNKQYRDFIQDLTDSGATEKLKIAMVDSAQWAKAYPSSKGFVGVYFCNAAFNNYPVVNISKPAAELYCQWLTEKYNATAKQKAKFMLPTELQWQYAARGGNPKATYPWPGNSLIYEKRGKWRGTHMCNCRVDSAATPVAMQNDTADVTAPSRSFMPNTFDVYNMAGNVAEMIADKPYTKGGSYLSHADKLLITAHEDANPAQGQPTIGFRPVMVME